MNPLSLIPGFTWVKFAAFAAGAIACLSAGAYAGYRWEAGTVAKLELADAQARSQAIQIAAASQKAQDGVALAAAVKEAKAQTQIEVQTVTVTKEIPRYVTIHQDATVCVPYGLVRLLDAAADQTDPSAFQLAPGQSDDTCSPVKASDLAGSVIANYSAAIANAEQLTALQAWIVANHAAQVQP